MKPKNLLSVYQGAHALEIPSLDADRRFKPLKSHEIDNLRSLCNILSIYGCTVADFDGFFVSNDTTTFTISANAKSSTSE